MITEFDFHELAQRILYLKEKGYTFEISEKGSQYVTNENVILISANVTWDSLESIISSVYFHSWKSPLQWLAEVGITRKEKENESGEPA